MITQTFDYLSPGTVDEALNALAVHREKAKLLAGGQSLIPLMKLGLSAPEVIIDLKRISSLSYVRNQGDAFLIGALTRHIDIENSRELATDCQMLPRAARTIGHALVRNRGTIGGSLAHCDPRADYLLVLMALEAKIIVKSVRGGRTIPAKTLLKGPFQTSLETDEIISEIVIPRERDLPIEVFSKFELGHGDFGVAAVAIRLWREGMRLKQAHVWVSGLGELPTRLVHLEQNLVKLDDPDEVGDTVNRSVSEYKSFSDFQSSARFRKRVVATLLKRSIMTALAS